MTRIHVVVVGGGYAGTLAANHLTVRPDLDVTLVNPRPAFIERIRLHQYVAGTHPATVDYGTLLGAGVRLVVDTAARIDAADRRLLLASGAELRYDYLIYAAGSTAAVPDLLAEVPGAAEFAYLLAEFEQAQRLHA
ncbi:MAG TPA: FAD-dependent oxidoreductase, partial [Mycobacterium sp.]|nr:FAD-dependent oxidoreductase [Mycobacterium sp.]